MHSESRRTVAGTAGLAEVIADGPGSGEHHQGEITMRRQQGRVVGDEPCRNPCQFVIADPLWDASSTATLAEPLEVIGQAEETVTERAAQIGDGGTHDEAGVV
jgi:hypothetical protein